jgi:DNA processing protein
MTRDDLQEQRAWLTALRTPGLGPGGLRARLDAAGGDMHAALAQLQRLDASLGQPAQDWLARRIAGQGAIVSEFPPGTAARPDHFPRRNRIISALALGTLVIEAGLKSGSLITARLAAEQGREVFALPGSIHDPLARGCHQLIRDGARLVETATEIVETLAPAARMLGGQLAARLDSAGSDDADPRAVGTPGIDRSGPCGDPDYRRLLTELGHVPATLDELVQRTGQSAGALSSMLLMLELERRVESLAGNRYQRLPDG